MSSFSRYSSSQFSMHAKYNWCMRYSPHLFDLYAVICSSHWAFTKQTHPNSPITTNDIIYYNLYANKFPPIHWDNRNNRYIKTLNQSKTHQKKHHIPLITRKNILVLFQTPNGHQTHTRFGHPPRLWEAVGPAFTATVAFGPETDHLPLPVRLQVPEPRWRLKILSKTL